MRSSSKLRRAAGLALALSWMTLGAHAADHADTPQLIGVGRHDARITDLHVFRNGDSLVLSLCTNPAVPVGAQTYRFPSDLTFRFHIDNTSPVGLDPATEPIELIQYGGRILHPEFVGADVTLEIMFDGAGRPVLRTYGVPTWARTRTRLFAGLRDDPFIRTARNGRNVAAVVIELPVAAVKGMQPTLLVWATADVPNVGGMIAEHAGRALRSQFLTANSFNMVAPRDHWLLFGVQPDVVILDLNEPVAFPNGRLLTDDVVDQVVDLPNPDGFRADDAPLYPTSNDRPFSSTFPYLAAPQ